jgi:hypothetical protein
LLGHEAVAADKNSIKKDARKTRRAAFARRAKPARAKPKLTAEIWLIKIKLLKSSPAKPANSNRKVSRGLTVY